MKTLLIIASASALLAGCASTAADEMSTAQFLGLLLTGTGETAQQMNAQAQGIAAQARAYQPPEVMQVKQPDGTTIIYCRALNGQVYACRQLN